MVRQPSNVTIPIGSETYNNTVHAPNFIADYGIDYELGSHNISDDVIALYNSPNAKFSHSIGDGVHCKSSVTYLVKNMMIGLPGLKIKTKYKKY